MAAVEEILVTGVTRLLKNLGSIIGQQINVARGVEKELKKLKNTLEMIGAVTSDAEEKQVKDSSVRLWLRWLRDVAYDADDVLDEFSYEAMRRSEIHRKRDKVLDFFSSSSTLAFPIKMVNKIKAINKKLDEITSTMVKFQLQTSSPNDDLRTDQQYRQTFHFVDKKIVGRENDRSAIIQMLMTLNISSVNSSRQENVSVIPVLGMGGVGKTALAQLVYQDDSIKRHFEPRAWVCVSDDFDIFKIVKEIIESVTNKKCPDMSNKSVLAGMLQKNLKGKRYLLVLDDLWNENAEDWEKLKDLLRVGDAGSKILITTRNDTVASVVRGIIPPYSLKCLSVSDCWSVIRNKAFSPGGAFETPNMIKIGESIASRCGGLPLAANVLGNLMRLHATKSDWLSILDHASLKTIDAKTKIISVLKLSYDKLPLHLKLCFSYCSLFPKDWVIQREVLVRLWIAEGFLGPSHVRNQISLEDAGNEYFHSLLASSFFQDVTLDGLGDVVTSKMHDLVHDLARSVNGVHDIKIVSSGEIESVSNYRRLQLDLDEPTSITFTEVLKKTKSLRSVFSLENDHLGEHLLHTKNLRVVCLLLQHNIDIALRFKHKHLRYLDLSYCSFDEAQDVSINQLYNLQSLVLQGCKNVRMTLVGIGSLTILRHLDLSYSDIEKLPDSVSQLTNLHTLDLNGCEILEALPSNIGSLKDLRVLKVQNCRTLRVLPIDLGALTRLRSMDLSFTKIEVLPESCISNLCNLEIMVFGGCKLPKEITNWPKLRILKHDREDEMPRGIDALTCLELLDWNVRWNRVTISCSGGGIGMEELSNLNSLQELRIPNLQFVRGGIDAERAKLKDKINLCKLLLKWGSIFEVVDEMAFDEVFEGLEPHPNVGKLEIHEFPGLKLPKWMGSSNCLPNLVELTLWNCNRCEKLPSLGLLPYLKVLEIDGMDSVKVLGGEVNYQQDEEVEFIGNVGTMSLFPSLVHLEIRNMKNLTEWVTPLPIYNSFPCIYKLNIQGCRKLRSTPDLFSFLKELRLQFTTGKAVNLMFATGRLTSLTYIEIHYCSKLRFLPLGILLQKATPNLQKLQISECNQFQGFVEDSDLNDVKDGDGDVDSDNDTDDGSETILSFSCPKINTNSNNTSNSLRSIFLSDCHVLTLLPDLRLFTSLRKLYISCCTKLESIPYDLKTLTFLEDLVFDFIQSEYEHPEDPADKSLRIANRCNVNC
ncbi:putative disease resistance protein RGA3 [Papaver somniferum]|uniref:putative disease resistance protein RGA3 n=1 Tax=Papaver somniferum TaxID=3469 RepID=UPI000E6F6874|nr:putative disease resistance protein RGA3 [Papaver somniferum]